MKTFYNSILLLFGFLYFQVFETFAQSTLNISLEATNLSVNSGNTTELRVRLSISNQNANNLLVWMKLPDNGSAELVYPTEVHPNAPYPGQNDQLQFVSAQNGGIYTASELTVSGRTIPANSVYWLSSSLSSGNAFLFTSTVIIKSGTLNGTKFKPQAFAVADNATQVSSNPVTVSAVASPNHQLSLMDNFLIYQSAKYLNYGSSGLFGITVNGPFSMGVETIYQVRIYEDLTNILPLIEDGGNGVQLSDFSEYSEGAVFDPNFIPPGGNQSFPAIYWDIQSIAPSTSQTRSFKVTIKQKVELGNVSQTFTRRVGLNSSPNFSRTASGNVNLGINETPSFNFALGERYLGSGQISGSNDLSGVSVPNEGIYYGLLNLSNGGLVALNHVLMFDKIPVGAEFSNAFLPESYNGQIFYSTTKNPDYTASNPPPVDINRLPTSLNPMGSSIWESYSDTPPSDKAEVTWVVFYVPKLASPFFSEPNVPVSVTGEVELKGKLNSPCTSQIANNIVSVRVLGKSFSGGEIEPINLTGSNSDPMQIVPDSPSVTFSSNFLASFYSANSTAVLRVNITNGSSSASSIKSPVLEISQDPIQINGVPGFLEVSSVSLGTLIESQPGLIKIQLNEQAINSSRTVDIHFKVPASGLGSGSFSANSKLSWASSCPPNSVTSSRSVSIISNPSLSVGVLEIPEFTEPGGNLEVKLEAKSTGTAPTTKTWVVATFSSNLVLESVINPFSGPVYFAQNDFGDFNSSDYPVESEADILSLFSLGSISDNGTPSDPSDDYWTSPFGENTTTVAAGLDDSSLGLLPIPSTKNIILKLRNDKDRGTGQLDSQEGEVASVVASIFSTELLRTVSNKRITTFLKDPISDFEQECLVNFSDLEIPTTEDPIYGVISGTTDMNLFPITKMGVTTIQWVFEANGVVLKSKPQNIIVKDREAPIPDLTELPKIEKSCSISFEDLVIPTATDNCKGQIQGTTNVAIFPIQIAGVYSITWSYQDENGNVVTQIQEVSLIMDDAYPTIKAPENKVFSISPWDYGLIIESTDLGTPEVSDNCGIASIEKSTPFGYLYKGKNIVTWTVTDIQGNKSMDYQEVEVLVEGENLSFSIPSELEFDTSEGSCEAIIDNLLNFISDPESQIDYVEYSFSENSSNPTIFPNGRTPVNYFIYYNNFRDFRIELQWVTVTDRELPVITAPADVQTTTGTSSCDAVDVALGQPTVSDNCGVASVTNNAPETYPLGTTTVTWTVTDNNGNIATSTQTVTVIDEQDPLVTAPADVTIQIAPNEDTATGIALGEAQTSDNCGLASVTNNALNTFPIGTTVVTWTATDNSGNTATATQNVTVTREVLPTITAPAAISVDTDAGSCFATVADLGTPSVTGEDIPADGIGNNAPETFTVGTTVVTWTVTDGNGNKATATQQVTVTDREAPFILGLSDLLIPADQGDCFAADVSLGEFEAGDNCSDVQVSNDAPQVFSVGVHTVTWTVTDAAGNRGGTIQRVTVQDREDPLLTAPADITVQIAPNADSATGVALEDAQASDNCGIQSLENDAPDTFPLGLTVVTWTATDNSGNTATAQQRVTVTREELPTINAPADITVDAGEGNCFAEGLSLGSPIFTGTGASVSNNAPEQFPVGITEVAWTVTDANGNTASSIQKVTVVDKQAPRITAPGNITVSEGEEGDAPAIDLGSAVATDNCGIASIVNDAPAVFAVGMTVVTWTATDVNGNESTALQVVTVDAVTPVCTIQIKTKPEIIVVLNKDGKGRLTTAMVDDGTSSSCGPVKLTLGKCDFTCADIGEQKVTFTAVDAAGTKASTEVTIKVVDRTKPNVSVPQKPYVKVIRKGDSFTMPDLRNRVTASDNCGFELHQCPEPGKVFRTAQNGWIEFEAKDPSGNTGKAKIKFKLLVVNCRKPNKNGKEDLEGSESLITVPWNTQLPTIAADYVEFGEGSDMELAKQINWSIADFDPLRPGFYQMEGMLPEEYREEGDNGPAITLPVLVLNKPLPVDIFAAKDRVSHKVRAGEILTGLHTVDPADDIHSYGMEPHPDVYLEKGVLVWKGSHMPEARTTVTVHSTDRAGQTISRQITLYRETDRPTDLLIYPNPAMQETNLMVQIPEGANVSIRIFDAAGRLVYQEESFHELSFTRKVDLRHFAQGMYQVIVQVDREILQGRIIKQ